MRIRGYIVRRNKTYSVVIDRGRGDNGKRNRDYHSGFTTQKAAEKARTKLLNRADEGSYVAPDALTLGDWLLNTWLPAMASTLRPTTLSMYEMNARAHIVPRLGRVELRKLGPEQLNIFYGELLKSGRRRGPGGLSPRTVRIIHNIIHGALRDAVESDKVGRNVAERAKPPKVKHPEQDCWSPEDTSTFLAATADDRLAALWHLVASTGMRRGEVLGLRWSDLDLDGLKPRLTINQTLVVLDSRPHLSEPKTDAGQRTLSLDPATVTALRAHRARQGRERLEWGSAWDDAGLVFVRNNGQPMHPERLSKNFDQAVKRTGLPRIRFHGLRHSYITMLLRGGQPLHIVSKRAGHSSPTVTSNVYSHVLPGDDEAVAIAGADALDVSGHGAAR